MNQVDYEDVAEFIYALGWRPNCDAQHTNLRDALPKLRAMLTPPVLDGGPAFPVQDPQAVHAKAAAAVFGVEGTDERDRIYTRARAEAVGGLTALDWFAGHALQALLAAPDCDLDEVSENAYFIAEQMVQAKARRTP